MPINCNNQKKIVTYNLPNVSSDQDGFTNLGLLHQHIKDNLNPGEKIHLNCHRCNYFEANMAAPLGAILSQHKARGVEVKIFNLLPKVQTILQKNGFLKDFGFNVIDDNHKTTLPYKIFDANSSEEFNEYLLTHLYGKGIPEMSDALYKKFIQSIFEMFSNSSTHSKSNLGVLVCGQYFPNNCRLVLTISDSGIGVRQNVRTYLKDSKYSSIDAIRWALKAGNTTKNGKLPGGMGLKLLTDFIDHNKGIITLVSRKGFYRFEPSGEKYITLCADMVGTTVCLEINTKDGQSYCLKSEADTK